ncbi:hypothetical protein [Saccharomonospora sp.]|uniref:hypothetical protein n=1 Tax=Saccharomonospora sp. TaxID=33913 RepID=UPI0026242C9E|nr:hypothetical protein [Saccharomonospora sp.]
MYRNRELAAAAALLLALTSTACSDGGDASSEAATQSTSTESTAATPDELGQLREMFDDYREALRNGDGEAAAELVTTSTIDHYGDLATLAATGGPEEIGEQGPIDRMTVALLRHDLATEEIEAMDGVALFTYAVEKDVIDESTIASLELDEATVADDRAIATVKGEGAPEGSELAFVRESDSWRLDLISMIEVSDKVIVELAKQRDVDEDELVLQLASATAGDTVEKTVFERP